MDKSGFEQWAIVELFGHQQTAGLVSEQVIAGQGFVRVDVPACESREAFTRLFGPSAIYSIIPTSEAVATAFAARQVGRPVHEYQLALPERRSLDEDEEEFDEDSDEDTEF